MKLYNNFSQPISTKNPIRTFQQQAWCVNLKLEQFAMIIV